MKRSRLGYYIWILSLAVALLLLILAAQFFTSKNINGLKQGNQEAAVTFTINNRLQEIVNSSLALEQIVMLQNPGQQRLYRVRDSLAMLGYNATVLAKLSLEPATKNNFIQLNDFIARQLDISYRMLDAAEAGKKDLQKQMADSLIALRLTDSIYHAALTIEKALERKLQSTFDLNTQASQKLSGLNKAFALIAIAAILIMGTIIINRHLRQVGLIKDLEAANEEVKKSALVKEQFLANMSHEIRTPLNAIKGFSRLMLQTELNEEQKKFADIIKNSSNNLLHLVNDILDIAKMEAGKMIIEQKEFDLRRMLQTLDYMFMNEAAEKQLKYSWNLAEDVPRHITGDADRLYQILINLISNAIKFTNAGFVQLTVSKTAETERDIFLQFKVSDSGIGIPAAKLGIIFERFQQVENNSAMVRKGTGLGLAIVKNLSQLLGGSVSVESAEGKGTTFTVSLPFGKVDAGEAAGNVFVEEKDTLPDFTGAKVLVAEDNKVNQLLIVHMLKQYGITPVMCTNGVEVLEALTAAKYDLLLLDIQMPMMDGYATAKAIRQKNNAIPVVAMTAYVMPGEKEKCLAAGMNEYLAKPLEETELQGLLRKILEGKIAARAAKKSEPAKNDFLLDLAGGDQQMAALILDAVKKQLPAEISKLEKLRAEKDITGLSAICHHLVSTISPLGNETAAIAKIRAVQKAVSANAGTEKIIFEVAQLQAELENMQQSLSV